MSNNSNNSNEKFCTKCGKKFIAVGREVICPACKQAAAEESKRAAVLRAKKASWNGESVPVRISGRASTVIRNYGAANNMPFAAALDDLLKTSNYFKGVGMAWEDVEPYKSRRMKKSADGVQDVQAAKVASKPQDAPQEAQEAQEARWMRQIKKAVVTSKSKTASKPQEVTKAAKTSKTVKASKAAKTSK